MLNGSYTFLKNARLVLLAFIGLTAISACQSTTTEQPVNSLSTSDFNLAQELFKTNCQVCHELVDTGPPFKDYLPIFANVENGQAYLINTVLFGLEGPITAAGKSYNLSMANYPNLSDKDIALILNYGLTAWDNTSLLPNDFQLITPTNVAKQREVTKLPSDVLNLRNTLGLP